MTHLNLRPALVTQLTRISLMGHPPEALLPRPERARLPILLCPCISLRNSLLALSLPPGPLVLADLLLARTGSLTRFPVWVKEDRTRPCIHQLLQ